MIVFCEYVIPENFMDKYRDWVLANPSLWETAELLENTVQPGVFVELWRCEGDQEALRIQKERLEGRSDWRELEQWVKGGREGLRIWTFRPVSPGA
jgi:hypothetical protein